MRSRSLVTVLAVAVVGLLAPALQAQDTYRDGRLLFVEPGVTIQRGTDVDAEEAVVNAPFVPGDRVWTDASGRAEFQFTDGSIVRLDRRSKLDYSAHEEEGRERVSLRLWSGGLVLRLRSQESGRYEVETPAGRVQGLGRALVRIEVESGETRVSVYEGEAVLDDGASRVRLEAGEETRARWGGRAAEPQSFDREERDDLMDWDAERNAEEGRGVDDARYMPEELGAYAGELNGYGDWREDEANGHVWVPRVGADWQPYSNGGWTWTPYGWTWVPNERWGWAPFHYGRWDVSSSLGWYWVPGRHWGPAWVSWAVGGGYVGWCPLGRRDQPVRAWGGWNERGRAGERRGWNGNAWNVVRQGELGRRDVSRRRLPMSGIDTSAVRAADSSRLRPTRDGRSLRDMGDGYHAVSRRQSPGDFVRELGVDNKTTIPAPWTRGYGPPPAGAEGARYGAQPRDRSHDDGANSATGSNAEQGGVAASPRSRPASGHTPSSGEGTATTGTERDVRSAPRTPAAPDASGDAERARPVPRVYGGERRGNDGARSGSEDRGERPRHEGASRPAGGSSSDGGSNGTGYRPRHEGGGNGGSSGAEAHPSGGDSHRSGGGSRSSGGEARSSGADKAKSGNGHATPRPRERN